MAVGEDGPAATAVGGLAQQLRSGCLMALNIASVVSIVLVNKAIFSRIGFTFPNILMAAHLAATSVGMAALRAFGVFALPETPPERQALLKLAGYQTASILFVNYSLMYNSVGLYQMLKLCNIPAICCLEYVWHGVAYSTNVKLALALLVVGIGSATVTDVSVNTAGLLHGGMGVATSAALQVSVKDSVTKALSAIQVCYYVSPLTTAAFSLLALVLDDLAAFSSFSYTPFAIKVIGLSCVCAFVINLTVFLIVGETSPVTYQVVGHLKTILVIVGGLLTFSADSVNVRNIVGMTAAMGGVVWYTYEKQRPTAAKQSDPPTGASEVPDSPDSPPV